MMIHMESGPNASEHKPNNPREWTQEEYLIHKESARGYTIQSRWSYYAIEALNEYEAVHDLPFTEWENLHDDDDTDGSRG